MKNKNCCFGPRFTVCPGVQLETGWNRYNDSVLKFKSSTGKPPFKCQTHTVEPREEKDGWIVTSTRGGEWTFFLNDILAEKSGTGYLCIGSDGYDVGHFDLAINGKRILLTLNSSLRALDGSLGDCPVAFPVKKGKNLFALRTHGVESGISIAYRFLSREEYESIRLTQKGIETLQHTSKTMNLVNFAVNTMRADVFEPFDARPEIPTVELRKLYHQYPILKLYDFALDKILSEIPQTIVPKNTVVAWHLYNMGYVFKTTDSCFAIDIHHRRAALLEPYLDFILTTHNHSDHYNSELLAKMAAAGKPVVSNFYPAKGYARSPRSWDFGSVHVEIETADHNRTLAEFMNVYRITCGTGKMAPVVYDSGDCCNHEQLNPSGPVDCHINHPRVGMDEVSAALRIKPRQIWFSHLWEMGHCIPSIWRPVTPHDAELDIARLQKTGLKAKSLTPMWGEKIVLKHSK